MDGMKVLRYLTFSLSYEERCPLGGGVYDIEPIPSCILVRKVVTNADEYGHLQISHRVWRIISCFTLPIEPIY